jgi:benzoylformate decarboxylase
MPIVQISERAWELGKNYPTEIAINANVRETLRALNALLRSRMTEAQRAFAANRLREIAKNNWSVKRALAREETAKLEKRRPMDPKVLMMRLAEAVPRNVVVVEEGLTSTFQLLNYLPLRDHQGYHGLASGGIGFAMGGAVGISIALPDRPVVAIVGDGSAMYSIQALWTAAHLKLPITYVIANNHSYRILKERLVSFRKTDKFIGMDMDNPAIDFVALAQSMGVPAQRITDPQDVGPALRESISTGGPRLIDVSVADGFSD